MLILQDLTLESAELAKGISDILAFGEGKNVDEDGTSIFGEFSDIFIESDAYITARRRNKEVIRVSSETIPAEVVAAFANIIASVPNVHLSILDQIKAGGRAELDGTTARISTRHRLRYNICEIVQPFSPEKAVGEDAICPLSITLRRYPESILTLAELGLPTYIVSMITRTLQTNSAGVIAVSGTTSSGKTLSCSSMLKEISLNRAGKVLMLEQPPEIPSLSLSNNLSKSTVVHRAIGEVGGPATFLAALEAAKRQNPDVIFLGEARDDETKRVTIDIATSGMMVVMTTHATSPSDNIRELCDASSASAVSRTLRLVMHQALIPSAHTTPVAGKDATFSYSKSYLCADVILIDKAAQALIAGAKFAELDALFENQAAQKTTVGLMNDQLLELQKAGKIDRFAALKYSSNRAKYAG